MKKIFTRLAVALVLSLSLLGFSTTANATPANSNWGGWFYNQTLNEDDGTTGVYQINATVNQTKTGKTITGSTVTCRYLYDPNPGNGTWQDWYQVDEFTSSTTTGDPVFAGTTQEELRQYCIANAPLLPATP